MQHETTRDEEKDKEKDKVRDKVTVPRSDNIRILHQDHALNDL
jgi:hypothetical protein